MVDTDSIVIDTEPEKLTVGQRLSKAREAKNYTIAEVAVQLRLTKDTIENLEAQHWEALHGRAYARGYFTSYVKFLGMDLDDMLAGFNLDYRATEPNLNNPNLIQPKKKPFPWMMLIFIALAALFVWFAYQQWLQNKDLLQDAELSWNEQASELLFEQAEDAFDESVVQPIDIAASEAAATETQPMSVQQETLVQQELDASEALAAQVEQAVETVVTSVEDPTSATIVFQTKDDCWVEVTDADNHVLLYKTVPAGKVARVKGKAPISVLLGNRSNVTVRVNGEFF
jgi:cytoskeleton protein RodZ